jgi:hypothetical protein
MVLMKWCKNQRYRMYFINISITAATVLIAFIVLELAARLVIPRTSLEVASRIKNNITVVQRSFGANPSFVSHPYLAYQPVDVEILRDGCTIDGDFFALEKPESTLRVACLGGSTTMRGYPRHLKNALKVCFPDKKIEVMDWGCSHWTIVESMLNYMLRGRLFSPDIVIVHHGFNDVIPMLRKDFRLDYSHYRKPFAFDGISWMDIATYRSWFITWVKLRLNVGLADLTMATVNFAAGGDAYYSIYKIPDEQFIPYKQCLDAITKTCVADNADVILAGMIYNRETDYPASNLLMIDRFNEIAKEKAETDGFLYVDVQRNFAHRPDYFEDVIHLHGPGDQVKGFLLASAAATVHGGTPCVYISDDENSQAGLPESMDYDKANDRCLAIHTNMFHSHNRLMEIFVRENGNEPQLLARIDNPPPIDTLIWKAGQKGIEAPFQDGPQFGNQYDFWVYTTATQVHPPFINVQPILFEEK